MPKGFGYGGESANQERSNLLKDNPVAKDASGGRPWISKHFQSSMSPLKDGHSDESPMSRHDGKTFEDKGFFNSHFPSGKPKGLKEEQDRKGPEMKDDSKGMPKLYDAAGKMKYDAGNAMYDAPVSKKGCHHNV